MLANPELDNPANVEAAAIYMNSPHLYDQLARDSVVATRRIELGAPIFNEVCKSVSFTEEGIYESRVPAKMPVAKANVSFDAYHAAWKALATSIAFVRPPPSKKKVISYSNETEILAKMEGKDRPRFSREVVDRFLIRNRLTPKQAKSLMSR
jgi:hypothetical protein